MLAIVDAQSDYAAMDPIETGRRLCPAVVERCPARRTGSIGQPRPGEPRARSATGVAEAQADGAAPDGHYGYNFRPLYAAGPGGAGRRA